MNTNLAPQGTRKHTLAAISVQDLSFNYGHRPALRGLNLKISAGGITGLMGDNGSGKTTLLKILAGVMQNYRGKVEIFGQSPGVKTKAQVAYLPDKAFLPSATNANNMLAYLSDFFPDFDRSKARELLGFFGLDAHLRIGEMSKGMGEKLSIALLMARRARLYLLDEPISGVDPATRQAILDTVLREFCPEAAMIISTHLIHDLEPVVDTAVFMRAGQTLLQGNADELRAKYGASLDQIFIKEFSC